MAIYRLRMDRPGKGLRRLRTKEAGVLCVKCNWRGYRLVQIVLGMDQQLDRVAVTQRLKGVTHMLPCPKCQSVVVYTHLH